MPVRLVVARGSRPTGAVLERLLQGVAGDATVSYGCRLTPGPRVLNAMAGGGNKYHELEILAKHGVLVPRFGLFRDVTGPVKPLPILARRFNHHGGTDIRLCGTPASVRFWAQRRDFWTQVIPNDREYRVWVYRNAHLGTYEKVKVRAGRAGFGRNYRNGYAFQLVSKDAVPRDAVRLGQEAIRALGLDFGAVDIIHGEDGKYYVLEVNSAPGVQGDTRQCIQGLARHIGNWVEKGCPARKERDEKEG